MGSEAKPLAAGNGKSSAVKRYLNAGFVAGFLLVVLTYLAVSQTSQQFAVTTPNAVSTAADKEAMIRVPPSETAGTRDDRAPPEKNKIETSRPDAGGDQELQAPKDRQQQSSAEPKQRPEENASGAVATPGKDAAAANLSESGGGEVMCSTESPFSDTCDLAGDVRVNGTALTVTLVPATSSSRGHEEWKVRPYSRRTMNGIDKVTVTRLSSPSAAAPPACTATHDTTPAIVFALGGLAGNYWHDFSDVLVPLFAASRHYAGEVQFLITNIQPWWLAKYAAVVRALSRYDAVDLDRDAGEVRCFRLVTVGLRLYKELSIVPERAPGGVSMADFTRFLRETYSLPRSAPVSLKQSPEKRPRLLLIHRHHYRKIVNVAEVVAAAEAAGFETTVMDPRGDAPVHEMAAAANSFDVLAGVHGAGLTNAVFLPAGAVVIQVVPYGRLEALARTDFGEPAADMGLRYVEYGVAAEESTLLEMLGPEHPAIRDPESVHRSGWDKVAEYYLGKQDVRINVTRFAPALAQAMDHLRRQ